MTEAKFIRLETPAGGLDYQWLRARGQEIIEKLAGEVWTDYNEHDPGVTTLEQLCYALTELTYRAQSPIEDLLTTRDGAAFDASGQALFAPQAILPCNPVTADDYRKLIADRVDALGNVWLTRCPTAARARASGLYDIELYAPNLDPGRFAATRRRVRRVFTSHRGLCEDLHSVRILSPVRAVLSATITIDGAAIPEAVLAAVFYRVGNLLAPELRREPLQALLDAGETPASIFSGPALRCGFVGDDQLEARPTGFTLSQITQCLIATEGVAGVRQLSLAIDGGAIESGGQLTLAVPRGSILRLDTRPSGDRFSVRLLRGGVEYAPNAGAVARELHRLWTEHRRRFDAAADAARLLVMPRGRHLDAGSYVSIQEQFPTTYGINRYGVGADATPERRAKARQFKAYLLAFEQLLADSFSMLDGLRELCAIAPGQRQQMFSQYLDACDAGGATLVPDVEPLLSQSYRSGLAALATNRDRHLERRNRFLDFVLATYGEAVDPVIPAPISRPDDSGSATRAQHLRTRLRLLRHLPRVGRARGRGGNYLSRQPTRQSAGLELRTRLQLGMELQPAPLAQLLGELRVSLRDAPPREEYALMRVYGPHIDEHFAPLPPAAARSSSQVSVTMTEELLVAASDLGNYRIGTFPDDPSVIVACRAPYQPAWQLVGKYGDYESALADARRWHRLAGVLRNKSRRIFVIEHLLLRGTRAPRADDEATGFSYGLTATAVVCLPGREANDSGYRQVHTGDHSPQYPGAHRGPHVVSETSACRRVRAVVRPVAAEACGTKRSRRTRGGLPGITRLPAAIASLMGSEGHHIRKQSLRVNARSEAIAMALQALLPDLNRAVLVDTIERVLDSVLDANAANPHRSSEPRPRHDPVRAQLCRGPEHPARAGVAQCARRGCSGAREPSVTRSGRAVDRGGAPRCARTVPDGWNAAVLDGRVGIHPRSGSDGGGDRNSWRSGPAPPAPRGRDAGDSTPGASAERRGLAPAARTARSRQRRTNRTRNRGSTSRCR